MIAACEVGPRGPFWFVARRSVQLLASDWPGWYSGRWSQDALATHGFRKHLVQRNLPRPVLRVAGFISCTVDSDDDIVLAIDMDTLAEYARRAKRMLITKPPEIAVARITR